MRDLIFSNTQNTFRKEYKTDLLASWDNFTVHDIKVTGDYTDDELIRAGISYEHLPYTKAAFIAFAVANNLTLTELDYSANTSTSLNAATALSITTSSLAAGTNGVAEVTTVTADTFANSTQGDYMILNNKAGESFAVWLDLDAAGTVPDGALFLATTYQILAGIATGDSAIQVAGKVKAAIELDANWAGFDTITDNGDGTLTVTNTDLGTVTNATVHDELETGAGSIGVVISPEGSGDYSVQLASTGGNSPYTYALDATSDALVAGITLSTTGLLSGVPTTTGTPDLVFKVTDAYGQTALSASLTLTVT